MKKELMRLKTIKIVKVLKNKLLIIILYLIIGNNIYSQIDTLNVYLEKNQEHRTGVDLVFENNSNDTIFLYTRFQNFSLGGLMPQHSGINITFFSDNNRFTFNWGEMPPRTFIFSRGFTLINPRSKIKLFFDVGYFSFPLKSSKKYEVSFFMNYSFAKYLHPETSVVITYFETNRVTIVEPSEDMEIDNP